MNESEIQKQCIEYLNWNRWYVIHNYKNKRPRVKGISDITIIKDGRTIWCEFKSETGKQRPEQIDFMNNIRAFGGEYIIIRSLEQLIDFFGRTEQQTLEGL